MRSQRGQLESELRTAMQEDDITAKLGRAGPNAQQTEKLFATELAKHDRLVGFIRQNISAQTGILQVNIIANAGLTRSFCLEPHNTQLSCRRWQRGTPSTPRRDKRWRR